MKNAANKSKSQPEELYQNVHFDKGTKVITYSLTTLPYSMPTLPLYPVAHNNCISNHHNSKHKYLPKIEQGCIVL